MSPTTLRDMRRAILLRALERRKDRDYRWSRFLRNMNRHAIEHSQELRRAIHGTQPHPAITAASPERKAA